MDGGQEDRGVQAVVGDGVSVGVRYASNEAAGAESSQVVGCLSGGHGLRLETAELGGQLARSGLVNPASWVRKVSSAESIAWLRV